MRRWWRPGVCHRRNRDWVAAEDDVERALELAEACSDTRRIADALSHRKTHQDAAAFRFGARFPATGNRPHPRRTVAATCSAA